MCVTGVCILRDLLAMALSLTAMKLDAALATCLRAHVTRKGSADPDPAPATSHYGPLESKNSKLNYPELPGKLPALQAADSRATPAQSNGHWMMANGFQCASIFSCVKLL